MTRKYGDSDDSELHEQPEGFNSVHAAPSKRAKQAVSLPCMRCSKGKRYDSNGLCIKCNFNKMMGGEVV